MSTVNRQTLRDQVVDLLREAILSGTYEQGQRLMEPEVANRFGVSLTPVREALNSLAATGLVIRSGRQGTYVRTLTPENVRNLFAVREALECLAITQATQHLTPEDHAFLENNLEHQAKANALLETNRTQATKRLAELNDLFHGMILDRSNNEWVRDMLSGIGDLLIFSRVRLRETAPWERRLQSLKEHQGIADALKNRDAALASRLMSEHLKHLEDHVIRQMLQSDSSVRNSAHALEASTQRNQPSLPSERKQT